MNVDRVRLANAVSVLALLAAALTTALAVLSDGYGEMVLGVLAVGLAVAAASVTRSRPSYLVAVIAIAALGVAIASRFVVIA